MKALEQVSCSYIYLSYNNDFDIVVKWYDASLITNCINVNKNLNGLKQ